MAPESEAKKRWMRENTTMITVKMVNKSDSDILQFLEGKQKATIIKLALREYMANHKEEVK